MTSSSSSEAQVSATELHSPANSPAHLQSTLSTPDGTRLTDRQATHLAIVLDLFQAKGTMAKMKDNFVEDAVYEDLFATCANRDEVAGQMVNLPTVVKCTETLDLKLVSITAGTSTKDGQEREISPVDEIKADFQHRFEFRSPLPSKASQVTMNTTLFIYSSDQGIVRLSDRPQDHIPDNALLSFMRKMNAKGAPKVAGLPKDDKEDAEKVLKEQR